jgi:signal peptidase I
MRNFIKAIIFAIILWVILNRTHIMTIMKKLKKIA